MTRFTTRGTLGWCSVHALVTGGVLDLAKASVAYTGGPISVSSRSRRMVVVTGGPISVATRRRRLVVIEC